MSTCTKLIIGDLLNIRSLTSCVARMESSATIQASTSISQPETLPVSTSNQSRLTLGLAAALQTVPEYDEQYHPNPFGLPPLDNRSQHLATTVLLQGRSEMSEMGEEVQVSPSSPRRGRITTFSRVSESNALSASSLGPLQSLETGYNISVTLSQEGSVLYVCFVILIAKHLGRELGPRRFVVVQGRIRKRYGTLSRQRKSDRRHRG